MNVGEALNEKVQPVPVMVMVPALGANTALAPVVSAPATLKLLVADTVALAATARCWNASVPELEIDPPYIVMVPEEGEKFAPAPTVSEPMTSENCSDVVPPSPTGGSARAKNCRVPELLIEDPSLLIVTVPLDGASAVEPLTVKAARDGVAGA